MYRATVNYMLSKHMQAANLLQNDNFEQCRTRLG